MWIEPRGTWELLCRVCFHCRCLKIKKARIALSHGALGLPFSLLPEYSRAACLDRFDSRKSLLPDRLPALPEPWAMAADTV